MYTFTLFVVHTLLVSFIILLVKQFACTTVRFGEPNTIYVCLGHELKGNGNVYIYMISVILIYFPSSLCQFSNQRKHIHSQCVHAIFICIEDELTQIKGGFCRPKRYHSDSTIAHIHSQKLYMQQNTYAIHICENRKEIFKRTFHNHPFSLILIIKI